LSFQLKILGSSSAIPAYGRNHTAQVLSVNHQPYLIDCGEATQIQLAKYKIKSRKINNIFISHLHGDHYLGLVGLLSSLNLLGRKTPLNIYGPVGLAEIITLQLKYSHTVFNYYVHLTELQSNKFYKIHEDKNLEVYNLPLDHGLPCSGFLFKELKKPIRINKERLPDGFSYKNISSLKKGEDILDGDGSILFKNKDLTLPPKKSRSYAYLSDTRYRESLIDYVKGADLLYHETTFLDENSDWAEQTFHSTTKQAARFAKKANVETLILGHFSARYKDLDPFLEESKQVFPNSELGREGKIFEVEET